MTHSQQAGMRFKVEGTRWAACLQDSMHKPSGTAAVPAQTVRIAQAAAGCRHPARWRAFMSLLHTKLTTACALYNCDGILHGQPPCSAKYRWPNFDVAIGSSRSNACGQYESQELCQAKLKLIAPTCSRSLPKDQAGLVGIPICSL